MDKKTKWRLVRLTILLAAVCVVIGCCSVDDVIFQPPRHAALPPDPGFVMLKVAPGINIAALFMPVKNAEYWILYSHGNAEDLYDLHPWLTRLYREHGYAAAFYDYEGYGKSGGRPGEDSACRDIAAVYQHMTGKMRIPPQKIIVLGRSVGSGPACYLAEKYPVAGLILESPFTSAFNVVTSATLPGDRFPNLERIKKITAPILIIHGKNDQIIPFAHGKKLFAAARGRKMFYEVPRAGHNNLLPVAGEAYWQRLKQFTAQLKEPKEPRITGILSATPD